MVGGARGAAGAGGAVSSASAAAAPAQAAVPADPPAGGLDAAEPGPSLEVEAFPGESQLSEDERNRWLVLHFALPRTIATCDVAAGLNTEAELNSALASMTWGSADSNGRNWAQQVEELSLDRPDPSLVSYAEFLDRTHPIDHTVEDEERRENARIATQKLAAFTRPDEPGAKLRPMFDQMVKSLTHSNKALAKAFDLKKAILAEEDVSEDPSKTDAQNIMRYGRHQILPSFWQLLVHLTKRNRRFSIVFRSFDRAQLSSAQRELRLFCQGEHPAYNGLNKTQKPPPMNGDKGSRDMRLVDSAVGRLDRMSGMLEFANLAPAEEEQVEGASAPVAARPTTYNFPPFHEVYAGLMHHVLESANTAAILDDRVFWEAKGRDSSGGKLFLLDPAAETKVQHIFFDGNIGESDAKCVDVRDVVTGEVLPFGQVAGLFLHRVDFFQAVTDPDYFIKALEVCELNMSQTILESRRAADAREAEADAADAASLPPKEYLYRYIIPALLPALEACQRDRPTDPLEFIAFYMLRHTQQYSKSLVG